MLDPQVMSAFNRVSHTAISVVGDDCKDDVILLGTKLGLTEEELKKVRPDLYERGTDNIAVEDLQEEDSLTQDEFGTELGEEETEEEKEIE